jgi:hypothetical protein
VTWWFASTGRSIPLPASSTSPPWRHGSAVGDLSFDTTTLRVGSADELAQRDVFPTLFRQFTFGRLTLSGAHGFQAWRTDLLAEVLPVAERLWDRAADGAHLRWAFDAAMVLAADALGCTPKVVHYPAAEIRDRDRTKIAEQADAVLRVLLSYQQLEAAGTPHGRF